MGTTARVNHSNQSPNNPLNSKWNQLENSLPVNLLKRCVREISSSQDAVLSKKQQLGEQQLLRTRPAIDLLFGKLSFLPPTLLESASTSWPNPEKLEKMFDFSDLRILSPFWPSICSAHPLSEFVIQTDFDN